MTCLTGRHRVVDIDLATAFITRSDLGRGGLFRGSIAFRGVELERERKRGRGYGAGHQGDLQALSHNRVPNSSSQKGRQTSPSRAATREPDGESLNQSRSIIGAADCRSNLSEGRRTTKGNLRNRLKTQRL